MDGSHGVPRQYLVEGALYALEQCGRLQRSAVVLFSEGDYASAIVLGAYGREELGRWIILRNLHDEVVRTGRAVTREEIAAACDDHVRKQQFAQLSVTQRGSSEDVLGQVMRTVIEAPPSDQAAMRAREALEDVRQRQQKRTPTNRHEMRMRSLYVEPRGSGWNRPAEVTRADAAQFLADVRNDYAVQYDQVEHGFSKWDHPELAAVVEAWGGRPPLPPPVGP